MSNQQPSVIFIVDDNPANVKLLSTVLSSYGYKILVAMDGLSAIAKITKAQPDLILLDILMPELNGFETCQQLQESEATRHIPIIFMTALASTADKVKGLNLGAVDYVTKPFQQEELIARLELHLKLRHLTQDLDKQNQKLQSEIIQRHKAEEALKIFSRVSEQSPASIVITNVGGDIEYVNPKFEELTGYKFTDVIGRNPRILQSGYVSEQIYTSLWDNITSGKEWHGELQNKKRNGELYWEQASISAIRDPNGNITHYVAVKEDITLRKQKELEFRQQVERERIISRLTLSIRQSLDFTEILNTAVTELRQIIAIDRVLVCCLLPDGSGKITAESVSEQSIKMLDMTIPTEIFPPEMLQYYLESKTYQIDDLDHVEISFGLQEFCRNHTLKAQLVASIMQQNSLWGLLVAHHSQTHQWQQWEIDLFRQVSDQMAIAIAQASLYQRIQTELAEKKLAENALQKLNQELEERVEKRTAALQESEIRLQENNGKLALANIELERATRLKDEFLANMSHELRTPLNAILGLSEALVEGGLGTLSDRQMKAITTVESSGQHLLSLITDILDLAKVESGKLELHLKNVDIKKLCNDSLTFVKQLAVKKNIQLSLNISGCLINTRLSNIQVDELRIRQVLINLLTNAVKFTPDGGAVVLEVQMGEIQHEGEPSEFYTDFIVSDTGIGIAPENISKLFQTFIQIDSALNRKYAGTGLGLSLVKKIVEMHKGSVDVESEVDKGSRFRVRLPYLQSQLTKHETNLLSSAIADVSILTNSTATPSTILIAEDNEANIESVSSYLENRGYQLSLAKNGKIAVEMAIAQKPDIILMDIQMPEMDGLTAMKLIRNNPKVANIPIIALTGLAMTGDRERCLEAGASEYLTKPFRLRQLADMIQELLASRSVSI
ncbi:MULTISPECIES: response regulator [Pseudanabaena]|uniref:response regulator n=1 Tax=Pseudanabaena TaxID=1152 RepID=UPI00247A992B|nr:MULTISPECIES: response regulator [Pseudanabaena]MEA5486024.1 response regulator [Pseudanabaena sp. CCNP1317]WGS73025.1 response regulator [Pseudanabaena galeata CCNP1313]